MPVLPRTRNLLGQLATPGTAARRRHLIDRHGRAALAHARAGGEVHALLPHIYVAAAQSSTFAARARATMEWLPSSVALTGLAACAAHGLLEHEPSHLRAAAPSPLHVRSPKWLTLRRCVRASPSYERDGYRVVSVAVALVHAWEEDPTGGAREAIFAALREGLTTVSKVQQALDSFPRVKGRRRLLAFLSHLRDGMHSWLEYVGARTVLNTPDLANLEFQTRFVIEGNVFYADRYDPVSRTVVEFDSARWHGSGEARAHDAWRDSLFRSAGVEPVRLPYLDVTRQPRACRERVRAVITSRLAERRDHPPP